MFKKKIRSTTGEFPTGTVVHTESGWYYINGRFKHRFLNRRVMKSWGLHVVETTDESVAKYVKTKPLGFRDGSLIRDITDGVIYLIAGKKRRAVTSAEAYERLGLRRKDAVWVSGKEVQLHERGEDIV